MNVDLSELNRLREATSLLGVGLRDADEACARASAALAAEPTRGLRRLVLAWSGEILLARRDRAARARLDEAARQADEAGHGVEALRLRLLLCRALTRAGLVSSAAQLLESLLPEAQPEPDLAVDWRLAQAATGEGDVRALWQEALRLLPRAGREHDRFEIHLGLGLISRNGGDLFGARDHWQRALRVAVEWQDDVASLQISALLGNLLAEVGLPAEAAPHLHTALDLAEKLGDQLMLVAEGLILSSVQLSVEDWEGADATAARFGPIAARRNNLLAVADAAITRAAAREARGDLEGAIWTLMLEATSMREQRAVAAFNLLKARLGEMRLDATPEVFDPLLARVAPRLPRR